MNNTFFELAQGFQTPVHTYNPYITGEYITKFEKKTQKMCIYIGKIQVFTNTQPNGSILYNKSLIQHAITKKFIIQYI